MSYTQRLTTSLGPGQAYIHSAQDPGTLPPTVDMGESTWVCKNVCENVCRHMKVITKVQGNVQSIFEETNKKMMAWVSLKLFLLILGLFKIKVADFALKVDMAVFQL